MGLGVVANSINGNNPCSSKFNKQVAGLQFGPSFFLDNSNELEFENVY